MKIKTARIWTVIAILVYILGVLFAVQAFASSEESSCSCCSPALPKKVAKYYKKQIKIHRHRGKRNWFAAKDKIWKIHQPFIREKAKQIVSTAIDSFPSTESKAKIVAAIILAFNQNSISQVHEWRFIQSRLQNAKYHYDQVDFYKNLLNE